MNILDIGHKALKLYVLNENCINNEIFAFCYKFDCLKCLDFTDESSSFQNS